MSATIKAIRRGIKATVAAIQSPTGHLFQAAGKTVRCSHCDSAMFDPVGVAGMFIASVAGYGIECSNCTQIIYFRKKPHLLG